MKQFPKLYRCRDSAKRADHIVCKDDRMGCQVAKVTLSGYRNDEPTQAEWAQLLSAAPDLLENLKRLVFRIDGVDGSPSVGEMDEARAAIAKAEGAETAAAIVDMWQFSYRSHACGEITRAERLAWVARKFECPVSAVEAAVGPGICPVTKKAEGAK